MLVDKRATIIDVAFTKRRGSRNEACDCRLQLLLRPLHLNNCADIKFFTGTAFDLV